MQEFNTAMDGLNKAMEEQKRKVAAQCRPIFLEQFKAFFVENPEIVAIRFAVSSEGYDDEQHYDEVTNFRYVARSDIDEDQDEHDFEDGPFESPNDYVYERARGEQPKYSYRTYPPSEIAHLKAEAEATIADYEARKALVGEDRMSDLQGALTDVREAIDGVDIEFHKIVFGLDVEVEVTAEGIKVDGGSLEG